MAGPGNMTIEYTGIKYMKELMKLSQFMIYGLINTKIY